MARPRKELEVLTDEVVLSEVNEVLTDEVVSEEEIELTRAKLASPLIVDEAKLNVSTKNTQRVVSESETVNRYYPTLEGMPANSVMKASINGFEYSVPRNKDVSVPKMFAEIFDRVRIAETGANIKKEFLHDRANPIIN